MKVHVIGPVIRYATDDHLIALPGGPVAVSTIYETLRSDGRFSAAVPEPDAKLDLATPGTLFDTMQRRIAKADSVVWVYHDEPAGAIEAGIAIAAKKAVYILAPTADLPRIITGLPYVLISTDELTLCDNIVAKKAAIPSQIAKATVAISGD